MSTLEEDFLGKKPDVGHFQIFGSLVYFHVTKDEWKNIDPITELGPFLRYTDTPHNYLVYLPTNRMKVVRGDVKFDEEKTMRCSLKRETQLHSVEELLALKEEPQDDVEEPHEKDYGVDTPTHAESSRDGRKNTKEAGRLFHDSRENMGTPTSQCRQRRSPERYSG